ncbi:MAG: hypothetical protein LBR72_01275 [Oscillospiraceae bacterium]|jgi:hypothetical protein|nr:hypothetical protein [Oscillospiraceae bacterium]
MPEERRRSGAATYAFGSLLTITVLSAVLAFAGFLFMPPYLVFASAAVVAPFVNVLLFALFSRNLLVGAAVGRILTFLVSAVGVYVYLCFLMGTVSGVYGPDALYAEDMQYFELPEYIEALPAVVGNALAYAFSPGHLFQDIIARGDAVWGHIAAAALFAQIGLPQVFIKVRKPPEPETPAQVKKR